MAGFIAVMDGIVTALLTACLLGAIYNYGEPSQGSRPVTLMVVAAAGVARFVWSLRWNRRLGRLLKEPSGGAAAKLPGMMRIARRSVALMLVSIGLFAAMFTVIYGAAGGTGGAIALGGLSVMCMIAAMLAARRWPTAAASGIIVAHGLVWSALELIRYPMPGLMWPQRLWMIDVVILWLVMLVFTWVRALPVTVQMWRFEQGAGAG